MIGCLLLFAKKLHVGGCRVTGGGLNSQTVPSLQVINDVCGTGCVVYSSMAHFANCVVFAKDFSYY